MQGKTSQVTELLLDAPNSCSVRHQVLQLGALTLGPTLRSDEDGEEENWGKKMSSLSSTLLSYISLFFTKVSSAALFCFSSFIYLLIWQCFFFFKFCCISPFFTILPKKTEQQLVVGHIHCDTHAPFRPLLPPLEIVQYGPAAVT